MFTRMGLIHHWMKNDEALLVGQGHESNEQDLGDVLR